METPRGVRLSACTDPTPDLRCATMSGRSLARAWSAGLLTLAFLAPTVLAPATTAAARRRPNVVLVTFDELAVDALRGRGGGIDAVRFPNFAALARRSTWFRNTVALTPSTHYSMPAILDGRVPAFGTQPDAAAHPVSLFTALGRHGYGIVTAERATRICPPRLCPHNAGIDGTSYAPLLGNPQRVNAFLGWVRRIRPRKRPTFWMTHVSLPHWPWVYLPSGGISRPPVPDEQTARGGGERYLAVHNEQRFFLQLQFTDRLLGRLLARLRRYKMLDKTLLVVGGDHGAAFGGHSRRAPRPDNLGEIGPVAFFVKAPRQRRPRVDDTFHRNVDITPTIADVLNLRLGYATDGRSAFRPGV